MITFRRALLDYLGWSEHWDHGLTEEQVEVASSWERGGAWEYTLEEAEFSLFVHMRCPLGHDERRFITNQDAADFLNRVAKL